MTTLSTAIGISTQLTDADVEQLYDLARKQYADPATVVRQREQSAAPEKFIKSISGYRLGDWIGSTPEEDRPFTRSDTRGVMSPATRADGYRETIIEEQTRRQGWLDVDPLQPEPTRESTVDDFQDVGFKRIRPQASFRKVDRAQVEVYKHTKQRAPKRPSYSIEAPEGADLTRPATKWLKGDWEPLWGINRQTGELYPVMSVLEEGKQLTRYTLGLEKRLLLEENYEDPTDELLSLDLLIHPSYKHQSTGQPVDISAAYWADMDRRDRNLLCSDEAAEKQLNALIEAAEKLGLA